MPGGDRTGPAGFGPMTGRGAGFCAGNTVPGYANAGRGWGWGRGMGRGRGYGRGFGFRGGMGGFMPAASGVVTSEQELKSLRQEAEFLADSLGQINERIEQLEKDKG